MATTAPKYTTITLAPPSTYLASPFDSYRCSPPISVNVIFTPDTSRYIVRGEYQKFYPNSQYGYVSPDLSYTLYDNFGQRYHIGDKFQHGESKVYFADGRPNLELHTIDGEDTSDWAKAQPIRPYYTPLPKDVQSEMVSSTDTIGTGGFGLLFQTALTRAYAAARHDATLKAEKDRLEKTDAELKEKDARIAALEARVKELELLEAKVKALEAQIEYATIPRIHIVSSPKPAATSDTTLLDLDDFFSTATSDDGDDIGNLPEFIHESP